jgi:hypothetical protein
MVVARQEVAVQAARTASSVGRHTLVLIAEVLMILAIGVTIVIGAALATGQGPGADPALAGKGGRAGSGSVTVSFPDSAFGSEATGQVSGGTVAWVHIYCRVTDGSVGLDTWRRPAVDGSFSVVLGPTPSWTGGGASCKADAGSFSRNGRFNVAGSTTFGVT